jgi:hypothetical protein
MYIYVSLFDDYVFLVQVPHGTSNFFFFLKKTFLLFFIEISIFKIRYFTLLFFEVFEKLM